MTRNCALSPSGCETPFFNAMQMADASGKAALARTLSKTWRFFGGGGAREASWSAARQRRFGPETGFTAIEEFCLTTPGSIRFFGFGLPA